MSARALADRQIAKCTGPDGSVDLDALAGLMARAYEDRDNDLRRVERASRLMSAELDEAVATLNTQNIRFKAALDNMGQGLCLFDASRTLAVCNRRFLEIYGLDPAAAPLGATLEAILDRSGTLREADPLERRLLISEHLHLDRETGGVLEQVWPGGRSISIVRQPVADGGFLDTVADVTESRLASARIAHLARHDALTDLPNRVLLRERLTEVVNHARRGSKSAVLVLDLDRFKLVNDTLGHPVGDALLVIVAERLRGCVRGEDTVARLGGDEFAVIQRHIRSIEDPADLARRIISTLSHPYQINGQQVEIGASVGIELVEGDRLDQDEVLRNADLALYQAKSNGRGDFYVYEPSLFALAANRRQLEIDLRAAMDSAQFEVHYQPQVDLRTNLVSGFEALVRWNDPRRGLVAPSDFIELSENTGLIDRLGAFVLDTACRDAMSWPSEIKVAVNLSPIQFKSGKLVGVIDRALRESGLRAQRLELEITEGVLLDDPTSVLNQLRQIKKIGARVSLDDFGTGYSSLSYIRNFPFDRIKIDQSFVKELGRENDDLAIIRAVTGLCSSLGIAATAEGVETEEQLDVLVRENCDSVQGYLFGKAVPLALTFAQIARLEGEDDLRSAG